MEVLLNVLAIIGVCGAAITYTFWTAYKQMKKEWFVNGKFTGYKKG